MTKQLGSDELEICSQLPVFGEYKHFIKVPPDAISKEYELPVSEFGLPPVGMLMITCLANEACCEGSLNKTCL